jgi:hypothetical protein
MTPQHGVSVSFTDADRWPVASRELERDGFAVFRIGPVKDAVAFFAEVKKNLPLDPPISGRVHWDALCDSLWYGLDALGKSSVAIVWSGADLMMTENDEEFQIALSSLTKVLEQLSEERAREGRPLKLRFCLVGRGPRFSVEDAAGRR